MCGNVKFKTFWFLQNKEFLLDKILNVCPLPKLNSLKHKCKSNRINGINFPIVGATFRKKTCFCELHVFFVSNAFFKLDLSVA